MVAEIDLVTAFLESIPDEKLKNFADSEHTILYDFDAGFRIDHQGLNVDKREHPHIHRLYVQPVGGKKKNGKGKSKRSGHNPNNGSIVARAHASNDATPEDVRTALLLSYKTKDKEKVVGYAPPRKETGK